MGITRKVALYGEPGARKTLQARYLIEAFGAENVGIISAEQGLGTIASAVSPEHVQEVTSLDELRKAYAWAKAKYTKPDQWVVVDGGSRIFNWTVQEVWQNVDKVYAALLDTPSRNSLDSEMKYYSRFITGKGEIDGGRAWSFVGSQAQYLMDAFIKLPCSLYMTFWEDRPSIDQYTKSNQFNIDVTGKNTRDTIIGAFDFIFRLRSSDKNTSKAICRSTATSFAKCRDDRSVFEVPDEIEAFNLAEFVKRLDGGK